MTLEEAKHNLKQAEDEYSNCIRKCEELKASKNYAQKALNEALIKNLPHGFKIVCKFYSGSYDRYWYLEYNGSAVCSHYNEEEAELTLAKKAHELFQFIVGAGKPRPLVGGDESDLTIK